MNWFKDSKARQLSDPVAHGSASKTHIRPQPRQIVSNFSSHAKLFLEINNEFLNSLLRNRWWFQLLILFVKRYHMHPKCQQVKINDQETVRSMYKTTYLGSGDRDTTINKSDDEMKPLNSLKNSLMQNYNQEPVPRSSSMKPSKQRHPMNGFFIFASFCLSISPENLQKNVFAIIFPQMRFIQPPKTDKEPSRNKKTPNPDTERDKGKTFSSSVYNNSPLFHRVEKGKCLQLE